MTTPPTNAEARAREIAARWNVRLDPATPGRAIVGAFRTEDVDQAFFDARLDVAWLLTERARLAAEVKAWRTWALNDRETPSPPLED